MANWVIRCAERHCTPLGQTADRTAPSAVAQADETPCHVQKDGRAANAKSFMFVYRSGEFLSDKPIVLYDYQKTRNSEHPEACPKRGEQKVRHDGSKCGILRL